MKCSGWPDFFALTKKGSDTPTIPKCLFKKIYQGYEVQSSKHCTKWQVSLYNANIKCSRSLEFQESQEFRRNFKSSSKLQKYYWQQSQSHTFQSVVNMQFYSFEEKHPFSTPPKGKKSHACGNEQCAKPGTVYSLIISFSALLFSLPFVRLGQNYPSKNSQILG